MTQSSVASAPPLSALICLSIVRTSSESRWCTQRVIGCRGALPHGVAFPRSCVQHHVRHARARHTEMFITAVFWMDRGTMRHQAARAGRGSVLPFKRYSHWFAGRRGGYARLTHGTRTCLYAAGCSARMCSRATPASAWPCALSSSSVGSALSCETRHRHSRKPSKGRPFSFRSPRSLVPSMTHLRGIRKAFAQTQPFEAVRWMACVSHEVSRRVSERHVWRWLAISASLYTRGVHGPASTRRGTRHSTSTSVSRL